MSSNSDVRLDAKSQGLASEDSKHQVEAMQKRLRELSFLHETSQVLTATLDLDSVLHTLMAQVRDYFRVEAVSVALLDEETETLVFRVAVGVAADEVVGLRMSLGQGIAGSVVESGEPLLVPDVEADERFYVGVDEQTGFVTRAILAVPIERESHVIGVIEAINPTAGTFDEKDQSLLCDLASLAAVAIHNADLYDRARQAERRYESLFDEGSDPVLVLDPQGKVLDINRRALEMFGRSRETTVGTALPDLLGITPGECQTCIQQALEGQHSTLGVKLSSPSGVRTLDAHLVRIEYGDREAIQWVGHDITEQVDLEQMREDLTHMVIHDLRNPLGSIMGSLQLIHTAFVEHDETLPVTKLLQIALRSGQKLYLLIDSLLDLGRLEAPDAELNKVSMSIDSVVQEAVDQIEPFALNKRLTVSTELASGLPVMFADRDLVLRVITNLLDNAVKFTRREGRVTVRVEQSGDEVLFTVSDTGIGIPPEYRHRIFDRFLRLDNEEGVKGTGLGLAFCKLAVEAHGGRIWVESEEGQGSQFKFTMPVGGR
jgi:NtrC-family two-component system sensor histidine kinase KinB